MKNVCYFEASLIGFFISLYYYAFEVNSLKTCYVRLCTFSTLIVCKSANNVDMM